MARAEERASILFDLKGGFNETPYAVDHNARRVQPCEEFKHARSSNMRGVEEFKHAVGPSR